MDQAARDTMKELETSSTMERPPRRPRGPKPGRKPGPKPKAAVVVAPNGHAPAIPAVRLPEQQLADLEGTAGRIRKALQALQA